MLFCFFTFAIYDLLFKIQNFHNSSWQMNVNRKSNKVIVGSKLRKHLKKPQAYQNIHSAYNSLLTAENKKIQRKALLKIIDLCYNNYDNQEKLTHQLGIPYYPGPISLHSFPTLLLQQNQSIGYKDECEIQQQTQLQFLFNFLNNVREYYYCWIIYFNQDMKILNVKLLKKDEVHQQQDMFNPILNLIGIFINKSNINQVSIERPLQEQEDYFESEYYGTDINMNKAEDKKKMINTNNDSTNASWKLIMKMQKIGQENRDKTKKAKSKSQKYRFRSISPQIHINNHACLGISQNEYGKYQMSNKNIKSFSIKSSKQKSKSQIIFQDRKKTPSKILLIHKGLSSINPIKQKEKITFAKSKLRKQSKVNKIQSIYFKIGARRHQLA